MVQNSHGSGRKYWATCLSVHLFACTAHSFACSALLAHSLTPKLIRCLKRTWFCFTVRPCLNAGRTINSCFPFDAFSPALMRLNSCKSGFITSHRKRFPWIHFIFPYHDFNFDQLAFGERGKKTADGKK